MATKKDTNIKRSETAPNEVLTVLNNIYGSLLHPDVIKSVALNCQWNLNTASNILAELTTSVSKNQITSKRRNPSPRFNNTNNPPPINTIRYAGKVNAINADVVIEEKSNLFADRNNFNHFSFSEAIKKKVPQEKPKKIRTPLPTKPVQNKSKRLLEIERVRDHILQGVKVLVLLRGLPGSGKSYLAKLLVRSTINDNPVKYIFSTDEYFERNGVFKYIPQLLHDAHIWNQTRVMSIMKMGVSPIIIDNTNTEIWEMQPYVKFAVQFGYAVEILEPDTSWIFNPPELARRNTHGVPFDKIKVMLNRYEKNVKPIDLFSKLNLSYSPKNQPPQLRLNPPLSKNVKQHFNIPNAITKNPPNQFNRNVFPHSIGNELNKSSSATEIPKKRKPRQQKKRSTQNSDGASSSGARSKSESLCSVSTSDDSDIDTLDELQNTENREAPYFNIETESADLISFNDSDDNTTNSFTSDLITIDKESSTINTFDKMQQSTTEIIDSCVKLFKEFTNKSTANDANKNNLSDKKSIGEVYPKVDLSSWGLSEEALVSWEVVETPKVDSSKKSNNPLPQRQTFQEIDSTIEVQEVSTNTCSEDFVLSKQEVINNPDVKVLQTTNRNITENFINEYNFPRYISTGMLDKGTMTGTEFSVNRCNNEVHHFAELVKLFPNVSDNVLRDIFEKCQGDVNWAGEILLDDDNKLLNFEKQETAPEEPEHKHNLDCNCINNYNTNIFLPNSFENTTTTPTVASPEKNKKNNSKIKPNISEESLLLQQQIKESFKIDDSFYSDHLSKLRKVRRGEYETIPATYEETVDNYSEPNDSNDADDLESEEDSTSDEDFIEMNVGSNFITQLENHFGSSELEIPEGYQPVLQLPASLVRQLHVYWLESVFQQMEAQEKILEEMLKQDEEFAKRLQEKEAEAVQTPSVPNLQEIMDMEIAFAIYKADVDQWKNETPDDLATRIKKKKLCEMFPKYDKDILMEMLQAFENSFDKTVEVLNAAIEENSSPNQNNDIGKQTELFENAKQEYIQSKQKEIPALTPPEPSENKTATEYRDEAAHHLKMRNITFSQAQSAIQKGQYDVAVYYSKIAQMHKQKYELANSFAASAFLRMNALRLNPNTLDLHYLYVKEAEEALAVFIDEHISKLRAKNKRKDVVFIITGRGKNSKGGVSHIKPAIKRKLKDRQLEFIQENPGFLRVIIRKNSILTNDLRGSK